MRFPQLSGRGTSWLSLGGALATLLLVSGCGSWAPWSVRSQSPEEKEEAKTRLLGDWAVPSANELRPLRVEGVGLVVGLRGTGSDPRPSPQRAALLSEMQIRGVKSAEAVLASPNTALVLVRGMLRPGIQEGDHFDLDVRIPGHDETSSLRGGYLLETRLAPMAVLGGRVREGNFMATAQGPLLIDPSADKKDSVALGRGRILGGGTTLKKGQRMLLLAIKPGKQNVLNSAMIETAINRRFHSYDKGIKVGMAKAKENDYLELKIHPRYKDNIQRYVQVIRSIALRENEQQTLERLHRLEKQLGDPETASRAALQLEAIGHKGAEALKTALASSDHEIRFYAAEALAYLDETAAAEPLAEVARDEPAFRVYALAALSTMQDYAAFERLRNLLDVHSAETRYGAFRALKQMNAKDPLVRGEMLGAEASGSQFSYHLLQTSGPPMVHVTRSRQAEIVLFGTDQRFGCPLRGLEAGNQILITSTKPGEVTVAKFAVGEADQKRVVSDRLDDVIRAVTEVGGDVPRCRPGPGTGQGPRGPAQPL